MRPILFLLLSFLALPLQAAEKKQGADVTLATIHYPPYNIVSENQPIKGFDADVTREAFLRMGKTLEIIILPWRRALAEAENGTVDGLLTCSPRQVFKISAPISDATDALFLNANHDFSQYPISIIEDLIIYPDLKIGGVAGYRQLKLLDNHNLAYDLSPDDQTAFKKLFAGRINVFLSIKEFGEYVLQSLNLTHLVKVIPLRAKKYHICFNSSRPGVDDLISQFNSVLQDMREDGTYARIHSNYK